MGGYDHLVYRQDRFGRAEKHAEQELLDRENLVVLAGEGRIVAVSRNRVRLRSTGPGWLQAGLRGQKDIYMSQLSGVHFRKPGMFSNGFVQFVVPGGIEVKGGSSIEAAKDENSIVFSHHDVRDFEYLYEFVNQLIAENRSSSVPTSSGALSVADEIRKLVELRDMGAISSSEFEKLKNKLMA